MRTIYLVRHGQPDIGAGKRHICLGRKDLPLSHEGEKQAERLARYFTGKTIDAVFSGPLQRCMRTAEILIQKSGHEKLDIQVLPELTEVDTGDWDGLEFSEIRKNYPMEYEARGKRMGRYVIPGGESFEMAGARFSEAFDELIGRSTGDILIVSHAGVIRAFLCGLLGIDIDEIGTIQIPYASVTILQLPDSGQRGEGGAVRVKTIGLRPTAAISLSEVDRMRGECHVPQNVCEHMDVVGDVAMNLIEYDPGLVKSDLLEEAYVFAGASLNVRAIYFAALLHDLLRVNGKTHARDAAAYLRRQGYLEIADLVEQHNDAAVFDAHRPISEAEVLYYADKLVCGTSLVTIKERFKKSTGKCTDGAARKAHEQRYAAAVGIGKKLGYET